MPTQEQVDAYLPKFVPLARLDAQDPISFGMLATPDYYMEFRYANDQAIQKSREEDQGGGEGVQGIGRP
jgi:pyruvate ferredoxin oxidoreductase alpha subunit